jgi:hypothetical protein
MGWKEAQTRRKASSLTPPQDEDLVGRKVLNGLGLVERQLPRVCRHVFGDDFDYEAGTWSNTRKLLLYVWKHLSCHHALGGAFRIESYTVNNAKEILERFEMWDPDDPEVPMFLVRMKGTKQSLAYSIWSQEDIGLTLKPPYKVIEQYDMNGGYQIAVQDTAHFIAQFGPYQWDKVLIE